MEFLENKTGGNTTVAHLISAAEIVNSIQQTGAVTLLIVNGYALGLTLGGDPCLYLVDSHIKDEKENLSNFGTTVLLIFDQLY